MKQQICQFGAQKYLNGILTLPDSNLGSKKIVVLVSAGFVMTSGPYRVYRELAERLASLDIACLRFDLGGIGNSSQIYTSFTLSQRTEMDIKSAIDYIQDNFEFESISLGGICSGAEDSFHFAEQDERIQSLILVDPHCYRTSGWWLHNFLSRYFVNRTILKLGKILNSILKLNTANQKGQKDFIDYQYTSRSQATKILESLLKRKVLIHYIYTGGMIDLFNHKGQLRKMFKSLTLGDRVTIDYLPTIEHTQMLEQDRTQLISTICSRILESH